MGVLEKFSLDGYSTIVTGAAMGLGKAMAKALAEAGSDLVLADVNMVECEKTAEEFRQKTGKEVIVVKCDVTKADDCKNVVAKTLEKFGKVDVLVNNAGICQHIPAEDMKYEDWQRVMGINLHGVFLMAQAAGRAMIKRKKGSIINISSMSGMIVNCPQGQCSYNASKAGVIMLTKCLASEWVAHNIRVNTIAPTYMETELLRVLKENGDQAMIQRWVDLTPMKRFGDPDELGGIAVYLASEASSLATGGVFTIDGGYTLW